jgi:hypothetical protein
MYLPRFYQHFYLLSFYFMLEQQQEKQYYSRDILDSSSTTKIAGELSFLQHNVGKRQEVQ